MFTIHIVLTNFCNQGCVGCYQPNLNDTKSILILNDVIKQTILSGFKQSLKTQRKIKTVKLSFFGGEPLTRADTILQILKFCKETGNIPDAVHIPTSGGKNQNLIRNPKVKEILDLKYDPVFSETKFVISQSYDGPNNLIVRNTHPAQVQESIRYINNINDGEDFRPEYTSCLIPETISEDYFIVTQKDVLNITGRLPNFRIPHLVSKDSNIIEVLPRALRKYFNHILCTNFVSEHSPVYQAKNLIKMAKARILPKLFGDFIIQMVEPKDQEYLWCGAGTKQPTHVAIVNNGFHPNGCEYLDSDARYLQEKMEAKCNTCALTKFCHRPCLKNAQTEYFEGGTHGSYFERQCQIRKIIFNEIRTVLLELQ